MKKAVIELVWLVHDSTSEYYEFRDLEMDNLGIHVLRIKN
jgi:hypothetical protein